MATSALLMSVAPSSRVADESFRLRIRDDVVLMVVTIKRMRPDAEPSKVNADESQVSGATPSFQASTIISSAPPVSRKASTSKKSAASSLSATSRPPTSTSERPSTRGGVLIEWTTEQLNHHPWIHSPTSHRHGADVFGSGDVAGPSTKKDVVVVMTANGRVGNGGEGASRVITFSEAVSHAQDDYGGLSEWSTAIGAWILRLFGRVDASPYVVLGGGDPTAAPRSQPFIAQRLPTVATDSSSEPQPSLRSTLQHRGAELFACAGTRLSVEFFPQAAGGGGIAAVIVRVTLVGFLSRFLPLQLKLCPADIASYRSGRWLLASSEFGELWGNGRGAVPQKEHLIPLHNAAVARTDDLPTGVDLYAWPTLCRVRLLAFGGSLSQPQGRTSPGDNTSSMSIEPYDSWKKTDLGASYASAVAAAVTDEPDGGWCSVSFPGGARSSADDRAFVFPSGWMFAGATHYFDGGVPAVHRDALRDFLAALRASIVSPPFSSYFSRFEDAALPEDVDDPPSTLFYNAKTGREGGIGRDNEGHVRASGGPRHPLHPELLAAPHGMAAPQTDIHPMSQKSLVTTCPPLLKEGVPPESSVAALSIGPPPAAPPAERAAAASLRKRRGASEKRAVPAAKRGRQAASAATA